MRPVKAQVLGQPNPSGQRAVQGQRACNILRGSVDLKTIGQVPSNPLSLGASLVLEGANAMHMQNMANVVHLDPILKVSE